MRTAPIFWWSLCVACIAIVRGLDSAIHWRHARRVEQSGLLWDARNRRIPSRLVRTLGALPIDDLLGPGLVASVHLELWLLASIIGQFEPSIALSAVVSAIAATRMRALQEITHYSVHGSLAARRSLGLRTSAWLFQFPLWRPTIMARVRHHAHDHHPHVNDLARDPNLMEYVELGFTPPLRSRQLVRLWLYPVTVRGLFGGLRSMWRHLRATPLSIAGSASLMATVMFVAGGVRAVVSCYVVPLLVFYPLLAWWSQLVEHRWFESPPKGSDEREYASGRVLNVSRFARWCLESTVLPFGDSLHLAHSIYPGVRWNYLPLVHRVHMTHDPRYRAVALDKVWRPGHPRSIVADVSRSFSAHMR